MNRVIALRQSKHVGRFAVIGGLCLLLIAAVVEQKCRLRLWYGATDVNESKVSAGFPTADYSYLLKARISEDSFKSFCGHLGLIPMLKDEDYQGRSHDWTGIIDHHVTWWHPKCASDQAYVPKEFCGTSVMIAKYEDGYLYYMESWGY